MFMEAYEKIMKNFFEAINPKKQIVVEEVSEIVVPKLFHKKSRSA